MTISFYWLNKLNKERKNNNIIICMFADNSGSYATEVRRFVDEALRMKEFDHPNVLSLIGVALDFDNLPLVVLPFMRHGDLLSYIRNEAHVSYVY